MNKIEMFRITSVTCNLASFIKSNEAVAIFFKEILSRFKM